MYLRGIKSEAVEQNQQTLDGTQWLAVANTVINTKS